MSQDRSTTRRGVAGLGPGQFSLRGLFWLTTAVAAFAAAGFGAFGPLAQAVALALLWYFVCFAAFAVFAILMAVLTGALCVLPIRLWERCCVRNRGDSTSSGSPGTGNYHGGTWGYAEIPSVNPPEPGGPR